MSQILVLSTNKKAKTDIRKCLHGAGHQVIEYQGSFPAQEFFDTLDLVVLDTTSFPHEAASLFAQSKTCNSLLPIIVIVQPGDVHTAVQFMRLGAANVLTLPIDNEMFLNSIEDAIAQQIDFQQEQAIIQQAIELLQSLRIQPQLPNTKTTPPKALQPAFTFDQEEVVSLGDLIIDKKREKASYQEILIDLTPSQFTLLLYLCESVGQVVAFEDLYFQLRGIRLNRASARVALNAHMSNLRARLNEVGCRNCLVNIRGRGYLLEIPEKADGDTNKDHQDLSLE